MSKQSNLFKASQPVSRHQSSQNDTRLMSPAPYSMPSPKRRRKLPAIIPTILLVVFGLALEVYAPPEFRASTFIGTRGGQLQGTKAEVSAPQEATAQAHIKQKVTIAEADVNFAQECRLTRQKMANTAWGECMSGGLETSIVCDVKRDQLNTIPCAEIPR